MFLTETQQNLMKNYSWKLHLQYLLHIALILMIQAVAVEPIAEPDYFQDYFWTLEMQIYHC
jgi:hypothetical protein